MFTCAETLEMHWMDPNIKVRSAEWRMKVRSVISAYFYA